MTLIAKLSSLIQPGSIILKGPTEVVVWICGDHPKHIEDHQNQQNRALPEKSTKHAASLKIFLRNPVAQWCRGHNNHLFFDRFRCRMIFPPRCCHLLSWGALTRERGVVGGYNQRSCGKMTGHYPAHSFHNRTPKHTFNSKLLQQHMKQNQQTTSFV